MGSETHPEIIVCEYSSLSRPQMLVRCTCKHDPVQLKSQHLRRYGGTSVPMPWAACTFGNSPSELKDMPRFYSNICSCAEEVHFRESIFQQDSAKPHTAAITTAWLCAEPVCLLSRLFTNWQHLAHHERKKYNGEDPGLLSSWNPISNRSRTLLYQNPSNSSPSL